MNEIALVDSKVIDEYLFSTGTKLTTQQQNLFKQLAILHNLNPFKNEIYAIPYGQEMKIVTGYEVYLKRAEETKDLNGWEFKIEAEGDDYKGVLTIYRKSWEKPFIHEVYMSEYNSGKSLWASKPKTMLKKVAVAQGFRLAFPLEFAGMLYTSDELSENVGHVEVVEDKITENQSRFLYGLLKKADVPMDKVLALFDAKTTYEVKPAQFRAFMGEVETVIGREAKNITENEYVLIANMIMTKLGGMVE
jgi:phage recombination protein Bet